MLPVHHLDRFWIDCWEMMPEQQIICGNYFRNAKADFKKYIDWQTSDWVASIAYQIKSGKKLMLIYNTIQDEEVTLNIDDVPADWVITTDRRYFHRANAIVFYLPDLQQELEDDLDKPQGQIWVSRYPESEKRNPWMEDPEIRDLFDLWWMCYQQDEEQKEHPLVNLCRKIDLFI